MTVFYNQSLFKFIHKYKFIHLPFLRLLNQSSRKQYSTINSYSLFFLDSCKRSSPVYFRKLKSTQLVSNHNLIIRCLSANFISPESTAQNSGVLPSVVYMLKISNLSGWSSKCSSKNDRTS